MIMKNLRALGITARAITCWVFGSWTENEARAEVNRARAMIGKAPMDPEAPR